MSKRFWMAVCLCTGVVTALPPRGAAQDSLAYEYAVKVLCGRPDRPTVAPGAYFTAINVHNPNNDSVMFRKKFALTLAREQPGPITQFTKNALATDQALEVDCTDVVRYTRVRFAKGFAVIQSPRPLDVVAVYSAAPVEGQVTTLHLERVPPRRLAAPACGPDLVVDSILRPVWDGPNHRSVITAIIRNVGTAGAPATIARVIDPSTPGPTGAPQNAIATTPPLPAGGSATVTFYLPYWVFNPDATLEVTADYKNDVIECREDNNVRLFEALG